MDRFLPAPSASSASLALLASFPVLQLLLGYWLSRGHGPLWIGRQVAWATLLISLGMAHTLTLADPPGFRMIALIAVGIAGVKTLIAAETSWEGHRYGFARWVAFAWLWFGMRVAMVAGERKPRDGAARHLRIGVTWALLGIALIVGAHGVWRATESPWAATPLILVGFSFVVHFGALNLCVGLWRAAGFAADPLFRSPQRSQSLGEFWSRRWNVGFSEMTAIAVTRPLGERAGRSVGVIAGFLFSGLLHELVISVPVMTGWGLPTAYFLLHGLLVLAEERLRASGRPLRGVLGRVWTFGWLIVPLPVLFHPAFLREIVWPMAGIAG